MNFQSPKDQCSAKLDSSTPHFFKIILDDTDMQKLRIPKKFERKYGSEISSSVSLKIPNGAFWKVGLTKCGDGTWLHNGWLEFAKHYSLSYGSFLVFRYEGNNNFHVMIFDKSATEISYPFSGTHGSKVPKAKGEGFQDHPAEDNGDDKSVEILDVIPPSKNSRVRSLSPSSRPHKKMSSTSKVVNTCVEILDEIQPSKKARVRSPSPSSQPRKTINHTSTVNIRHSALKSSGVKYEIPPVPEFNAQRSCKRPQQTEVCRTKPTLREEEKAKALLVASSFKSNNPSFVLVMQPSYVTDNLSLPYKFCGKYLPKHSCDVILSSVCQQKTWSVRLAPYIRPQLYGGWKVFVRENKLGVGDVCAFELINQTKITFNVVIFQRVQDSKTGSKPAKDDCQGRSSTSSRLQNQSPIPDSPPCKLTSKTATSAPQGFTSFESENPFFTITTQPYIYKVCVPYSFVKKHIKLDTVSLTLQNGDKPWAVRIFTYPKTRYANLGAGWLTFARENSVKSGQVCAFELINEEDAVLRVHILKKSAN